MSIEGCPKVKSWQSSLPANQSLRRNHVVDAVIHPHHNHMLESDLSSHPAAKPPESHSLGLRIRQLAHRLDKLPVAGIDRIFRTLDSGEAINGMKRHVNLRAFHRGCEVIDLRRRGVHFEAGAFAVGGQRLPRRMRRRVRGNDLRRCIRHREAARRRRNKICRSGFLSAAASASPRRRGSRRNRPSDRRCRHAPSTSPRWNRRRAYWAEAAQTSAAGPAVPLVSGINRLAWAEAGSALPPAQ